MIKIEEIFENIEKAKKWDHNTNYKDNPLLYEFTNDCGGMYTCEPYKSKILKRWKFTNSKASENSSYFLYEMFLGFLDKGDFVGADMIRKYFQAGSTRRVVPGDCKKIFLEYFNKVNLNLRYIKLKEDFLEKKRKLSEEGT